MTSPPAEDPGEWVALGTVAVDSGFLLVIDPAQAAERPEEIWDAVVATAASSVGAQLTPSGLRGVAVPTGHGDGVYPAHVRVVRDDSGQVRVAELRIEFG